MQSKAPKPPPPLISRNDSPYWLRTRDTPCDREAGRNHSATDFFLAIGCDLRSFTLADTIPHLLIEPALALRKLGLVCCGLRGETREEVKEVQTRNGA